MQLSPTEILVVAVIALLVLGPDRLPKAARQVGQIVREFRNFSSGVQSQLNEVMDAVDLPEPAELHEETKPKTTNLETPASPKNPNLEGFRLIDGGVSSTPVASVPVTETSSLNGAKNHHPSNGNQDPPSPVSDQDS